ncbi:hypothetical protein ABEB36_003358 [Hypothenemus hampei]
MAYGSGKKSAVICKNLSKCGKRQHKEKTKEIRSKKKFPSRHKSEESTATYFSTTDSVPSCIDNHKRCLNTEDSVEYLTVKLLQQQISKSGLCPCQKLPPNDVAKSIGNESKNYYGQETKQTQTGLKEEEPPTRDYQPLCSDKLIKLKGRKNKTICIMVCCCGSCNNKDNSNESKPKQPTECVTDCTSTQPETCTCKNCFNFYRQTEQSAKPVLKSPANDIDANGLTDWAATQSETYKCKNDPKLCWQEKEVPGLKLPASDIGTYHFTDWTITQKESGIDKNYSKLNWQQEQSVKPEMKPPANDDNNAQRSTDWTAMQKEICRCKNCSKSCWQQKKEVKSELKLPTNDIDAYILTNWAATRNEIFPCKNYPKFCLQQKEPVKHELQHPANYINTNPLTFGSKKLLKFGTPKDYPWMQKTDSIGTITSLNNIVNHTNTFQTIYDWLDVENQQTQPAFKFKDLVDFTDNLSFLNTTSTQKKPNADERIILDAVCDVILQDHEDKTQELWDKLNLDILSNPNYQDWGVLCNLNEDNDVYRNLSNVGGQVPDLVTEKALQKDVGVQFFRKPDLSTVLELADAKTLDSTVNNLIENVFFQSDDKLDTKYYKDTNAVRDLEFMRTELLPCENSSIFRTTSKRLSETEDRSNTKKIKHEALENECIEDIVNESKTKSADLQKMLHVVPQLKLSQASQENLSKRKYSISPNNFNIITNDNSFITKSCSGILSETVFDQLFHNESATDGENLDTKSRDHLNEKSNLSEQYSSL